MITDEMLERIFSREDVAKVPLIYQSTMIHVIDEELEKEKSDDSTGTLSKYDL